MQVKLHLGGNEPFTWPEKLNLADHPLRVEAGSITAPKRMTAQVFQARRFADRIARRLLEARSTEPKKDQ